MSNVAQLPIQTKKQDIKSSSGSEGWRRRGRWVEINF